MPQTEAPGQRIPPVKRRFVGDSRPQANVAVENALKPQADDTDPVGLAMVAAR